ncbi:E1A [Deer mastadenovirus B]|uniref:E1A n=1 Tax=Deer mastadenovirus B TaxID=2170000 RepID=A0A1Y0B6F1_9ADEN|nr:E1A [Deer mastadenovirus B]ART33358.1 E1A [Deer mastadenovirus B]
MKYLVLVLNDTLSHIQSAILCTEADIDLRCHEVLSPSLRSSPAVLPASPPAPELPPPLSPVFPPSPPPLATNSGPETVLREYRRHLLERSLVRMADGARWAVCPCERIPVASEDECMDAVNLLFPEPWLEAAEEGADIFGSPNLSPESWIDLSSYDSDVEEMANHFSLDCPEEPGRECSSCGFHRAQSGVPGIMCSLCYMRQTYHCIYSPVSEEEV